MAAELNPNATDYAVAVAKTVLGMVPVAGPFLAELAGNVIPKQRADRLADYARGLSEQLSMLGESVLRDMTKNERFTDLVEEGAREAAQAVSSERREYIARLVSKGLTEEQVSYVESKHLLRLLSQLNDIEIIWLRFYDYQLLSGDEKFRTEHAAVLEPIRATLDSGPDIIDKEALQLNYVERLVAFGLLSRPLSVDSKTRQPIFDPQRGEWKTQSRRTTPLGRLLLRQIGIAAADDAI